MRLHVLMCNITRQLSFLPKQTTVIHVKGIVSYYYGNSICPKDSNEQA